MAAARSTSATWSSGLARRDPRTDPGGSPTTKPESFSGWVAPRWGLGALGLDPGAMTWVASGSHLSSMEAVKNGAAEAAGVDSMVLDLVAGDVAPAAGLVTIESFGPWPAPPISTAVDMDPAMRAELFDSLTSMHEDPAGVHLLATWGVEQLVAVDAAEYDRLARFAETTAIQ